MSEADAVQVHQERDHGGGGEDVMADGGGGHGDFVLCSWFLVLGSWFVVWGVFGLGRGVARNLWRRWI